MSFTDIFIRRPVFASVISLLILLIGLKCMLGMPIRQFPLLTNTLITISTSYPGATEELIQGFITQPLEQAVGSAEGIDYMTSVSNQGQSTISIYVQLNYDPDKVVTEVLAKVNQVKYLLPKATNDPAITKQTGQNLAVVYIGFSSKELSQSAISDYLSRVVQPQLTTIYGVAAADILGGQLYAMRLWLDPRRMAAHGVTADQVLNALQANNFQAAPGQTKGYFTITNITADTNLSTTEEFRRLVVRNAGDALVRIEDVGSVQLDAQSYTSSVSMNGQQAVFIGVTATPDGNPLTIMADIRKMLPDIQRNLPPAIQGKIVYDTTRFITASIDEVEKTLGEAVAIVIIVIFLFLGNFRAVLIPVVTIPLSVIGAGIIMVALGFSINLLTLLAMVLAIGLVVDDAIVVVENVYRWIEHGKTPAQAAIIGAREIVRPVISMTITLAAVYAPIGFLGGVTGALFREFAFTLAGAVIISGIIALVLSPMMCSMLLTGNPSGGGFAGLIDRVFNGFADRYERLLGFTLGYRWVTGIFALAVLASAAFMFLNVKTELAPQEDQAAVGFLTKTPVYGNLDYQNAYNAQVDKVAAGFPEVENYMEINGAGPNGVTPGQGIGFFVLKPWEERTRTAMQLVQPMQQKLGGTVTGESAFVFLLPALPGNSFGLPVQMVINSVNGFEPIYKIMEQVKAAARKSGLFLVVDSDLDYNSPYINLHIDRSKASNLGLTMQSIGDTLATMAGGNFVNLFDLQGRSYQVIPQTPRADRFSPDDLTRYYVLSQQGKAFPLSDVVTVEMGTEPNALTHYNQLNSATLSALPMPGVSMGQAVAFLDRQAAQLLPAGYTHSYLADARQYVQEGSALALTFVFALVVIFLVLAAQFESWRDPLVVMVTVPMAISGALIPLFFWVTTMNIYSEVGLVTLIGLISKHGILMVEFAREGQLNQGWDRLTAIRHAARIRLRPILMTTGAMVMGLFPLLIAAGAGASSRFAIGVVIVFGMTIGTLFTLFVLPAVYSVLAKDHRAAATSRRAQEIAEVI
jgi:multidrug efflux pump